MPLTAARRCSSWPSLQYLYSPAAISVLTRRPTRQACSSSRRAAAPCPLSRLTSLPTQPTAWSCDGSLIDRHARRSRRVDAVAWHTRCGRRVGCARLRSARWQRCCWCGDAVATPCSAWPPRCSCSCRCSACSACSPLCCWWCSRPADGSCSAFNWMINLGFTLTLSASAGEGLARVPHLQQAQDARGQADQRAAAADRGRAAGWSSSPCWPSGRQSRPWQPQHHLSVRDQRRCTCTRSARYSGASLGFFTYSAVSKCLMLALGVLLAFNSRDVAQQFNESKSIAMSVYNIVLALAIIAPIVVFIQRGGRHAGGAARLPHRLGLVLHARHAHAAQDASRSCAAEQSHRRRRGQPQPHRGQRPVGHRRRGRRRRRRVRLPVSGASLVIPPHPAALHQPHWRSSTAWPSTSCAAWPRTSSSSSRPIAVKASDAAVDVGHQSRAPSLATTRCCRRKTAVRRGLRSALPRWCQFEREDRHPAVAAFRPVSRVSQGEPLSLSCRRVRAAHRHALPQSWMDKSQVVP